MASTLPLARDGANVGEAAGVTAYTINDARQHGAAPAGTAVVVQRNGDAGTQPPPREQDPRGPDPGPGRRQRHPTRAGQGRDDGRRRQEQGQAGQDRV